MTLDFEPEFQVFIPGAPGAKGRPRFNRKSGRTYTPAKTVAYETYLKTSMAVAMADGGLEMFDRPVKVFLDFYMPEPKSMAKKWRGRHLPHTKRPDLDNLVKAVLDAMNEVVVADDKVVWNIRAMKIYGTEPGVSVAVKTLGEMVP